MASSVASETQEYGMDVTISAYGIMENKHRILTKYFKTKDNLKTQVKMLIILKM